MVNLPDFINSINFHTRTIFKMLALEQSAQKRPFSAGGGGHPIAPTPLGYGPVEATELESMWLGFGCFVFYVFFFVAVSCLSLR